MHNSNIPKNTELPSTRQLIKSTVMASIAAGIILVIAVMPAEYGIDPTGMGKVLGLQKMGEIKVSLAAEAMADKAKNVTSKAIATSETIVIDKAPEQVVSSENITPILNHEMQITLAPNEGTEIKVTMQKGKKVSYTWWTSGGRANFDVHGDSKKLGIDYHSYGKGSEQRVDNRNIVAFFDGNHGWFWRNRTSEVMTVTLQTNGEYTKIKHMK